MSKEETEILSSIDSSPAVIKLSACSECLSYSSISTSSSSFSLSPPGYPSALPPSWITGLRSTHLELPFLRLTLPTMEKRRSKVGMEGNLGIPVPLPPSCNGRRTSSRRSCHDHSMDLVATCVCADILLLALLQMWDGTLSPSPMEATCQRLNTV